MLILLPSAAHPSAVRRTTACQRQRLIFDRQEGNEILANSPLPMSRSKRLSTYYLAKSFSHANFRAYLYSYLTAPCTWSGFFQHDVVQKAAGGEGRS